MRREKVDFDGETIAFTLISLKIIVQTCQYVETNAQPNSKLDNSKKISEYLIPCSLILLSKKM